MGGIHAVVPAHILAFELRKAELHWSLGGFHYVLPHLRHLFRLFELVKSETLLVCALLQHFQLETHQRCPCTRLLRWLFFFSEFGLVVILHLVEDYIFRLFYVYLVLQLLPFLIHFLQSLVILAFDGSLASYFLQLPHFRFKQIHLFLMGAF